MCLLLLRCFRIGSWVDYLCKSTLDWIQSLSIFKPFELKVFFKISEKQPVVLSKQPIVLLLGVSCCFLFLITLCLCHFDFWILISIVKVMFLQKCYQFYVVLLLIILVSWFCFECSFMCLFSWSFGAFSFYIWVLTCILDLYKFLNVTSIMSFEVLNSVFHLGFLCFSWKHADCFNLLQFLCLLEISEIMDLSS